MSFQAEDARQLQENPIFKEAVFNIRERIITQLEILPPDHDRVRDELVISLQMIKAIQKEIQNYIDTEALDEEESGTS